MLTQDGDGENAKAVGALYPGRHGPPYIAGFRRCDLELDFDEQDEG